MRPIVDVALAGLLGVGRVGLIVVEPASSGTDSSGVTASVPSSSGFAAGSSAASAGSTSGSTPSAWRPAGAPLLLGDHADRSDVELCGNIFSSTLLAAIAFSVPRTVSMNSKTAVRKAFSTSISDVTVIEVISAGIRSAGNPARVAR